MKKVAVLYHSGVGNTKKVAVKIHQILSKVFDADLYSVEKIPKTLDLNCYDGLVIGFPVIHTHPTKTILKFINNIERLAEPKPIYVFTTCGLYSANTLRIFAKYCIAKNIIPVLDRVFWGCPATDGTLLAPFIKLFYTFPKNLDTNIAVDVKKFINIVNNGSFRLKMPKFKIYSILNYPNKLAGQLVTFTIYLHNQKCSKCGKCIINCPTKALTKDENGYPLFHMQKCEKCYRCIHHCPNLALSLNKRKTPKKVLISHI